jgi:hypothetical protein
MRCLFALGLAAIVVVTACGESGTSRRTGGTGGFAGSAGATQFPNDAGPYDAPVLDASDASKSPSALCSAYIRCVAETTPSGLAATMAAYGEGGTCWETGDHALCETGCHTGIVALHKAFFTVEACNFCSGSMDCPFSKPACDTDVERCVECMADPDCSDSSKPACETSKSVCVPCTSNDHCSWPMPICMTTVNQCRRCLDSSHCSSDAPVCDPVANECFECLADKDCAQSDKGHRCDPVTRRCGCGLFGDCGPGRLCEGGACCTPSCGNAVCGASWSLECGYENEYACGVCPNGGQCFQGACSYIGIPCTPGNTDCGAGNSCVYNVTSQSYVCLADIAGVQCSNVYNCYVAALGEGSHICSPANVCRPYCLQASDCASGVCEPWSYDGSITPTSPGVCKVP